MVTPPVTALGVIHPSDATESGDMMLAIEGLDDCPMPRMEWRFMGWPAEKKK